MARPVRPIIIVLLALILLTGLVVLIIWLSFRPKKPVYTIQDASIQGFNIANNQLSATFNFVIRAYNPNKKVSIYYDKAKVSVSYGREIVASNTVDPFFQPPWDVTQLGEKLVAQNVSLTGTVARDLGLEKAAGEVELDVRMKAKVRFKVGSTWKSRHWRLRIFCSPVFVLSSSSKSSRKTSCHTSL